jgi:hypothetical protein
MTGRPPPIKMGHLTYHGLAADTDPMYSENWTISPVPSSSPSSEEKSTAPKPGREASKPEQPLAGIRGKRTPPASPDISRNRARSGRLPEPAAPR